MSDMAGAAERVSTSQDAGEAAIAGLITAEIYGLAVIAEGIETNPRNYTRFVVVGREPDRNRTVHPRPRSSCQPKRAPGALSRSCRFCRAEDQHDQTRFPGPSPASPGATCFYIDIDEPRVRTLAAVRAALAIRN